MNQVSRNTDLDSLQREELEQKLVNHQEKEKQNLVRIKDETE